jgi:SAM-dependent methyltransferase
MLKYVRYLADFKKFKQQSSRFKLSWQDRYPCLNEKTSQTYFDRHYVYHTGWAARSLAKINPDVHVDISSSLYFISIASGFVPIKFYDYRPAKIDLSNLESGSQDLLNLSFEDESIKSLSCMHVVEHVGLGRYGDPIDPAGDLTAIKELRRVLAPGGSLLFVVPVGKPKIFFNAHRVYSYEQIISYFDGLKLKEFALIPEHENNGEILYNPMPNKVERENYGCGCFWFTK